MDETKDPNRFFNARLGSEGKLRILLSQAPSGLQISGNQDSTQGVDNQSRVRSYRRTPDELVPQKQGLIEFYDLGYKVGTGTTLFTFLPNYTIGVVGPPVTDNAQLNLDLPSAASYADLYDLIFADPVKNFKTLYQKIASGGLANAYSLQLAVPSLGIDDFLEDRPEFGAKGYKAPQEQLDAGLELYADPNFFINNHDIRVIIKDGASHQKITATRDYSDPAVVFTPSKAMKIFLAPGLPLSMAGSQYWDGSSHYIVARANYFYTVQPREWVIDPMNADFQKSYRNWPLLDTYATTKAAVDAHRTLPSTRTHSIDTNTGTITSGFAYLDPPGTGVFGDPNHQDTLAANFSYWMGVDYGAGANLLTINGVLKAVVVKGSTAYYIWTDGY